jgi:hypothetical protein
MRKGRCAAAVQRRIRPTVRCSTSCGSPSGLAVAAQWPCSTPHTSSPQVLIIWYEHKSTGCDHRCSAPYKKTGCNMTQHCCSWLHACIYLPMHAQFVCSKHKENSCKLLNYCSMDSRFNSLIIANNRIYAGAQTKLLVLLHCAQGTCPMSGLSATAT